MKVKEAVRKTMRFYREEVNKKKSLVGWRKPRGIHHKSRLRKQGHSLLPRIGYGGAKVGKNLVCVATVNDLNGLNKANDVVILSGKLGMRKKIIMIEEVKKRGFIIYNHKENKKQEWEDQINKRKEENKKKQEKRVKTKEEIKKKKEEKKEEAKKDQEEKKKEMSKKAIEGI